MYVLPSRSLGKAVLGTVHNMKQRLRSKPNPPRKKPSSKMTLSLGTDTVWPAFSPPPFRRKSSSVRNAAKKSDALILSSALPRQWLVNAVRMSSPGLATSRYHGCMSSAMPKISACAANSLRNASTSPLRDELEAMNNFIFLPLAILMSLLNELRDRNRTRVDGGRNHLGIQPDLRGALRHLKDGTGRVRTEIRSIAREVAELRAADQCRIFGCVHLKMRRHDPVGILRIALPVLDRLQDRIDDLTHVVRLLLEGAVCERQTIDNQVWELF